MFRPKSWKSIVLKLFHRRSKRDLERTQGDEYKCFPNLLLKSQPARSVRSWWSFRSLCFSGTWKDLRIWIEKVMIKPPKTREVVDPAPGKLTWHLKNGGPPWTRRFLLEIIIFRVHVTFRIGVHVHIYIYIYIFFLVISEGSQIFGL